MTSPLLRSPLFPGIDRDVAAVSRRAYGRRFDDAELPALIAAIRAARVGGSFWAPPPPLTPAPIVALPRDWQEFDAAIAAQPGERLVLLLPDEIWAHRAAVRARRRGLAVAVGEVDPWPLLDAGARILCHADDEWRLLAAIAGCEATPLDKAAPWPEPDLAGALLRDAAYRDPFDDSETDALAAITQLAAWRAIIDANAGIAALAGISWWKRRRIGEFLWAGGRRTLKFAGSADQAVEAARGRGAIAVWPSRTPSALRELAEARGVPLMRMRST